MISAFTLLFGFGLISIALHRTHFLKLFALLGMALALYATYLGEGVALSGFMLDERVRLFEIILELVLFAFVLHEDDETTITQILFIGASSMLLLESQTVLSFLLSFESLSLISVILVSLIDTKEQAQGAVKMFIAGALSTGFLFLGVAFYVMGGGALLEPLTQEPSTFESLGIFIMLIALFYKLTIVPFHGWAADTYALVRESHAALLSGVAKSVVGVAAFHIFTPTLALDSLLSTPLLVTLAIATMTLGNFLALFREKISQMLAYSSIAHAGYMLLAFVALKSEYAQDAILYIAIAYIFMQSAAFLVLDTLKKHYNISTFEDIKGFSSQNAILAFMFTLQLFSLAGIPLLAGFLGKAVVFYAVVDSGLWWVALIALLNSALSVGYYAWLVKSIYFDSRTRKDVATKSIKTPMLAQFILLAGTLYFGIFAGLVFGV